MPHPRQYSRLLIHESPLLVLPSLAKAIGLNEAIFLQQLHYWLQKSGKPRDGRIWIYNTYEDWERQLPFWSKRTVQRIALHLEEAGLLVSSVAYNQSKMDKTKWYAIDYDELNRRTERVDDDAKMAPSSGQIGTMDDDKVAPSVPETSAEINGREDGSVLSINERTEWERRQEERRRWLKGLEGQKP